MIDYIPLIVTIFSHLTMIPTICLFFKKKLLFEFCMAVFGLSSSLLYHMCQCIHHSFFLSSTHWHRLDNVTGIAITGLLSVHFCFIRNAFLETSLKYLVFVVSMIFQEENPWDIRFTVAPVLLYSLLPATQLLIIRRQIPPIDKRNLFFGALLTSIAVFFFVLGLNDAGDPYRLYHGTWHLAIGASSYFLWDIFKRPVPSKFV